MQNEDQKELNAQLKEKGITLSKREKDALLQLAPSTRTRKINEIRKSMSDISENPFKMLSMIDGRTSTASYAIAAISGTNKALAVRRLGRASFKVKCYPNLDAWGLNKRTLLEAVKGADYAFRNEYERFIVDDEGLGKVIDHAMTLKGVTYSDLDAVRAVLNGEQAPRGAVHSPATGFIRNPKVAKTSGESKGKVLPKRPSASSEA